MVLAGDRRESMAVGDRFAPGAEIRLHADEGPAAVQSQAETRPDVVQDERRLLRVAKFARAPGERRIRQFLVESIVVAERRRDHSGEIAAGCLDRPLETGDVVVDVFDQMRAILGRYAERMRRAPWHGAVIGAPCGEDLSSSRGGARQRDAGRSRVGPILREQRPVRMGYEPNEALGQFHHSLAGTVEQIAGGHLAQYGLRHSRMLVAENIRSPATHEIDIATAVDVPDVAAFAALEELRIAVGQSGRSHVAEHAPGYDAPGACAELL